jgi:hypothetical protein
MDAGASEFVRNDCGASAAQDALDDGEKGCNERLFEDAIAGEDEVGSRLHARLERQKTEEGGGGRG